MVGLVPTEGFARVAVPVLLLCSPGPPAPPSQEMPGRSSWRPALSSANSALWGTRLWQHLQPPGVISSEKMEIFLCLEDVIIASDRALSAARLSSSYRTAAVLQGSKPWWSGLLRAQGVSVALMYAQPLSQILRHATEE